MLTTEQGVDEGSSRLNKKAETVLPIACNHYDVCKFKDQEDPNYTKVLGRLQAEIHSMESEAGRALHHNLVEQRLKSVPPTPDGEVINSQIGRIE